MEDEKKQLLNEQIKKLDEVLAVLGKDFNEETEEEINFLSIAINNLKEL